jgi:hypothetical protein
MTDCRKFLSVFGISVAYCFEYLSISRLKKRGDARDLAKLGGGISVVKKIIQGVRDRLISCFGR